MDDIFNLSGEYLRGYMEKYDGYNHDVYLFYSAAATSINTIYCIRARFDDDDGYRDSDWSFEELKGEAIPDLDSDYKVIGEYINLVAICRESDGDETCRYKIKTKTRIMDFKTYYFDSYYPSSLWELI